MERFKLKPLDLLRRCRSESSITSFVNLLGGQYSPYEYGAHGHGPNEHIAGNANADHTGGGESDTNLGIPTYGDRVDSFIALARRMAGGQSHNVDVPESSSSSRGLAGTATILPPYVVTHFFVFWRNGVTINDGPLRDLDDPYCDNLFSCLRSNYMHPDLVPSTGGYILTRCILRNENYPADPARLDTRIEVDETRPTTILQLRFSDHTREDVRFNLHHTVADIRAYFDASRPQEDELYHLLVVLSPRRYWELNHPDQTIQQAGLDNSIIEQRRY